MQCEEICNWSSLPDRIEREGKLVFISVNDFDLNHPNT